MTGERIKNLRIQKKLSQNELASQLFVSRQTIGRWERGETIPNTDNIVELAHFFNVDTAYFLSKSTINETDSDKRKLYWNRHYQFFVSTN
ncbi:hypothetical protein GCM10008929_20770 [Alkalibacterium psychrotolerans]